MLPDPVPVLEARSFHRLEPVVCCDDEDRAAVVLGLDAADEDEPNGGRALVGFQPFHFEGFLREVGEPATELVLPPPLTCPPDMARLLPIAARNGMEILGPPGPPPGR